MGRVVRKLFQYPRKEVMIAQTRIHIIAGSVCEEEGVDVYEK